MGWRPYKDKYQRRMEELCRWMDKGAKKAAREAERRRKAQARRAEAQVRKAARSQARNRSPQKRPAVRPAHSSSGCTPGCLGVLALVLLVPFAIATVASFFAAVSSSPFANSSPFAESNTSTARPIVPNADAPAAGVADTAATTDAGTVQAGADTPRPSDSGEVEVRPGRSERPSDGEPDGLAEESRSSNADIRTWTDSSGNYSIQAQFVAFEHGEVRLKKLDGNTISIAPGRLSIADREHLKTVFGIEVERKTISGRVTAVSDKRLGLCEIHFNESVAAFKGQARRSNCTGAGA